MTGKATLEIGETKNESELTEGKVEGGTVTFVELLNFRDNQLEIRYTGKIAGNNKPKPAFDAVIGVAKSAEAKSPLPKAQTDAAE